MRPENPYYRTRRTAEFSARDLLIRKGYGVIRVAQSHNNESTGINLVAWDKDGKVLFIYARSRGRSPISDDIRALSNLTSICHFPGNVQYWIQDKTGWIRYQINPGGALPLPVL